MTDSLPNTSAEILLKWGDGDYLFKLGIKEIDELQRLSDAGFGAIAMRVMRGGAYLADIYHTIRLGLIGGGLSPVEAKRLIDMYVDGRPLASPTDPSSPLKTAMAVLNAAWFGVAELNEEADNSGKTEAATGALTSLPSMGKARTSDGRRKKSVK